MPLVNVMVQPTWTDETNRKSGAVTCGGALRITPGQVSQGRPVLSGLESGIFILGAQVPGVQVGHLSGKPLLQGICSTHQYEIGLWLQIRIMAHSELNISTLILPPSNQSQTSQSRDQMRTF